LKHYFLLVCNRDLAVALTVFSMRLELARARALEGLQCVEEESPEAAEEHLEAFTRGILPDRDLISRICATGEGFEELV
jgi:hypothetical protein